MNKYFNFGGGAVGNYDAAPTPVSSTPYEFNASGAGINTAQTNYPSPVARFGSFVYFYGSILAGATGLTPNAQYDVIADFCDNEGGKKIHLDINSTRVLTDYSRMIGNPSVAFSEKFTAVADSNGSISVIVTGAGTLGILNSIAFVEKDTTPPTVSLTAPSAGATLSGVVSLAATAADNIAVASVQFKIDGVLIQTVTAAPYTASLNTANYTNSGHTLTAVATDTSGNTATSANVTVTIYNLISNAVPYNDATFIRNRFYESEPEFPKATQTLPDGGKRFNELSDSPTIRWELVYQFNFDRPGQQAQCTALDNFFAYKRDTRPFDFIAKDGTTYLNVYHESYKKSHEGHRSWFQTRTIILVKHPSATTDVFLTDGTPVVFLTDG